MAFGTRQQKPQVWAAPIDQAFLEGEDGPHPVLKHQPQHLGFPASGSWDSKSRGEESSKACHADDSDPIVPVLCFGGCPALGFEISLPWTKI